MPSPIIVIDDDEIIEILDNDETPPEITYVDEGDRCSFCLDDMEDSHTYYRAPCGHLFCYLCLDQENRLNMCTRCNQPFFMGMDAPMAVLVPVKVLIRNKVIEIE